MKLNLTRPLIVFDLETTGLDFIRDRIIQISYIKVSPDGTEERENIFVNPEKPIPHEVVELTGITDDDVKDCPTFKQVARSLASVFEGSDVAGFNSNRFDIPMLQEEFLNAGVDFDFSKRKFVDVQTIFHKMEQRNLVAAYKFYCGKDLEGAHSADADTRATYEVLKAQLDKYPSLQNEVEYLSAFSTQNKNVDLAGRFVFDDKGVEVFNFGKYKGMSVAEVLAKDTGYYGWMMKGDFPQDTKNVLTKIYFKVHSSK